MSVLVQESWIIFLGVFNKRYQNYKLYLLFTIFTIKYSEVIKRSLLF